MATSISLPGPTKGPLEAAYVFGRYLNQFRWYSIQATVTGNRPCRRRALEALCVIQRCAEDVFVAPHLIPIRRILEDWEGLFDVPENPAAAEQRVDIWESLISSHLEDDELQHDLSGLAQRLEQYAGWFIRDFIDHLPMRLVDSPARLAAIRLGRHIDCGLRPKDVTRRLLTIVKMRRSRPRIRCRRDEDGSPTRKFRAKRIRQSRRFKSPLQVSQSARRSIGSAGKGRLYARRNKFLGFYGAGENGVGIRSAVIDQIAPREEWRTYVEIFWRECKLPEPLPVDEKLDFTNQDAVTVAVSELDATARVAFSASWRGAVLDKSSSR